MTPPPKVLLVANVAKEHICKFHIPTIHLLREHGWQVDVACKLDAPIPEATSAYNMCWERSPFTLKTFKGILQLKSLIRDNHYDIIYCHTPVGGLVSRFAARRFRKSGTKVVYCAHGLHFFKGAPIINWLLFYPMEKLMALFTDMFITINSEDFERVRNKFNHKMTVKLINGIGVNFSRLEINDKLAVRQTYRKNLGIPEDAIVLIYVAEIIKNKNQGMLIRTLELLRQRGHNCWLLLPGPDHQNGEFKNLADDLGLNDYVFFLGWRSDVGELMAASDIYVASSIREGFGINLVEAQYCGLPVVATSNRGHRAIIRDNDNGFLVRINDIETMTTRIEELIGSPALYQRMTQIDVSSYSCGSVAETIEQYLFETLNK